MNRRLPIYEDRGRTYVADTCRPVVEAVRAGTLVMESFVHGHYPGKRLPRHALRGVKSIGYWDAGEDQTWQLAWHRNEGIEVTFVERGRLPFAVDEQSFELQPYDLTVTRPWQLHRLGNERGIPAGRLHWLILDVGVRRPDQAWRWPSWIMLAARDIERLTTLLRHNEYPVWRADRGILRCFQSIAETIAERSPQEAESHLIVRINELFVLLLELLSRERPPLDASLSETRRSVELFLKDLQTQPQAKLRQWTVRRMADQCGLGVTQFTRYCRMITNLTPAQYLNQVRLRAAADLLQHTDLPIYEVARRCGFRASQYFATVFRRRYGCSPRAYRRKYRL
ncbi:MAG: AraC family transcriptional regulator [Planctomycetota bacterium]|nr:MAG: AraC family transcriptional regulator [Planctomycetota bacterium]